jgi:hypothetical protein
MTMTVGLSNPSGTINRFGLNAAGSTSEVAIVGPIAVPANDEHHVTDFHVGVAKGSSLTVFKIYYQPVGAAGFIQVDEIPVGDYGSNVITLGTSHKFKAGENWKVTFLQGTIGRVSMRVGGQTRVADSRD